MVGTDRVSAWSVASTGQNPSPPPHTHFRCCCVAACTNRETGHLSTCSNQNAFLEFVRFASASARCSPGPQRDHHGSAVNINLFGTQSTLPRILGSPVWGRIGARQGGGQHTVCNVASLDPLASSICTGVFSFFLFLFFLFFLFFFLLSSMAEAMTTSAGPVTGVRGGIPRSGPISSQAPFSHPYPSSGISSSPATSHVSTLPASSVL